jgi:hypothetical protein
MYVCMLMSVLISSCLCLCLHHGVKYLVLKVINLIHISNEILADPAYPLSETLMS